MISAKERIEIDWDTANRLTEETRTFSVILSWFANFIRQVRYANPTGI